MSKQVVVRDPEFIKQKKREFMDRVNAELKLIGSPFHLREYDVELFKFDENGIPLELIIEEEGYLRVDDPEAIYEIPYPTEEYLKREGWYDSTIEQFRINVRDDWDDNMLHLRPKFHEFPLDLVSFKTIKKVIIYHEFIEKIPPSLYNMTQIQKLWVRYWDWEGTVLKYPVK